MSDYEHDIGYYVERWIEAEEEVKELRKEVARLRALTADHRPCACGKVPASHKRNRGPSCA